MQRAGIPTAALVAYGEECGPLWEKYSFILTGAAPGQTVDQFLRKCQRRDTRRQVFDALAAMLARRVATRMAHLLRRRKFKDFLGTTIQRRAEPQLLPACSVLPLSSPEARWRCR